MINYSSLRTGDPELYESLEKEFSRQQRNIELIASENFVSENVMLAAGSTLTNKYAEGYPSKRYYGGCQYVDIAETLAIERAKKLFGAEHANVQPHSGANANFAVYFAVLNPGDTILGLSLAHGGHLTHGAKITVSGKYFNSYSYGVRQSDCTLDYDEMERIALEVKPKIIVSGASAYPRKIDFKRIREICDKVGAYMMIDIAHIAGLVAAGLHESPVPYADFVTSTTHKTLRGPRGGLILCKEKYAKIIDKAVFPGTQGGPLMHIIAAKAVAFGEALKPEFKAYQEQILRNAKAMSEKFNSLGVKLVSGGTDNHLMLLDLTDTGVSGKELETMLDEVHITVNKNSIPFDTTPASVTSGVRLGTPSITTRGFKEEDCEKIAELITKVIREKEGAFDYVREQTKLLTEKYPLYKGVIG